MCGLFGFSDPKHVLNLKQVKRLTSALATASEERGTDASGIAYVHGHTIRIFKRPRAAHTMPWMIPVHTTTVMGHTRMATQGNAKFNRNNHPFPGQCGQAAFALAHNGVLRNEGQLRKKFHLPKTGVETDSYAAVQLLEQETHLDAQSICRMAERLEGTFALSILDQFNNLYLVKGNNPLCICRFENGLLCYASTNSILKESLGGLDFLPKQKEIVSLSEGDVLCVRADGRMQMTEFDTSKICHPYYLWDIDGSLYGWYQGGSGSINAHATPLDILLETAGNMGFLPEDILLMLEGGYCEEEIESLLNTPGAFYAALMELYGVTY